MRFTKNVWWMGVVLLLLLGCSYLGAPISTPVPPTATSIPPTSTPIPFTATQIPAAATSISLTVPPRPTPTLNAVAEQAKAFADPILAAIANYPPYFEDDFSTNNKGWRIGGEQKERSAIVDGVARLIVTNNFTALDHERLNRKDFVLQIDARMVEGDHSTTLVPIFHLVGAYHHFNIELSSAKGHWIVRKLWGDPINQQTDFVKGWGVRPKGEWTRLTVVARGPRVAVYLNESPVAYFEDADFDRDGSNEFQCITVTEAVCEYDNVRFWSLAKIPGLP